MNPDEIALLTSSEIFYGAKATNDTWYYKYPQRKRQNAMRRQRHEQKSHYNSFQRKMINAPPKKRAEIFAQYMKEQRIRSYQDLDVEMNSFFSPRLDILPNSGCYHKYYERSGISHMINDLYFGLLHNTPQKDWTIIIADIYNSHICVTCALKVIIRTNNLKSFEYHITKYSQQYISFLEKRPMYFCNELMNLWQITLFFVQILNYPVIIRYFMSEYNLFKRVMMLLHWFIDRWRCIGNLKDNQMTKESDLNFTGYTIFNIVKHHDILLEFLYCLISHAVFYWNDKHIKWYLVLDNEIPIPLVKKYAIDSQRNQPKGIKKSGYKWHMYTIFSSYVCVSLTTYEQLGKIKIKDCLQLSDIDQMLLYQYSLIPMKAVMQRMNQCHYRNYLLVRCNNRKCNKKYWDHVYGKEWNKLRLLRDKTARLPHDIRINKWYTCAACCLIQYCSRKCQKYDWNRYNHKLLCNKLCSL